MGPLPRPRGRAVRRGARRSRAQLQQIDDSLHDEPGLAGARVLTGARHADASWCDQRVENLRVPILLVVFQIGAVTLAVLAGVGSLVLTRQAFELAVLHSRGFSRRTLLLAQRSRRCSPPRRVPARAPDRLGPREPRGRDERTDAARRAVPRAAEHRRRRCSGPSPRRSGRSSCCCCRSPTSRGPILEERRLVSREDRPLLARVPVELFVLPVGVFAFIELRGRDEAAGRRGRRSTRSCCSRRRC